MTATTVALRGLPAAPGVVRGPWQELDRAPLPAGGPVTATQVDREIARLREASVAAAAELDAVAEKVRAAGHRDEAAIFSAQAAMALDPAVINGAAGRIRALESDAVGAVQLAAAEVATQLRALDHELLRARATDVLDVADRIVRLLSGLPTGSVTLTEPAILVGEDLAPSLTATLPRDRLLGIVLEGSSPTAHAAILARAYGIPAVVGVAGARAAMRAAGSDATIAMDGATGDVVIAPDDAVIARFDERADAARLGRDRDRAEAHLEAVTLDGTAVTMLANIGTPAESEEAVALGATGVGLFRTEFLFLERSTPPDETEQADAYREVVEAFRPGPVTVRLLDVGGDKPIPYIPIDPEANPFLGVRALRLAGTRPELFVAQLRACYRAAAAGPIKVMAPMIADAGDVRTLLALAEQARTGLVDEGASIGDVALGVMLEIPSAILTADAYFDRVAFASLGTNDLLQYTLAADRGNAALSSYRDSLHPAVLRLIRLAAESADRAGIELSVCGEMAGDPVAALALVGLGVRSLSMSAPSLPAVRRAIRASRQTELATVAEVAMGDATAAEVRVRFEALFATV